MADEFSFKFSLFQEKEKKAEKSPDRTGVLEIQRSQLPAFVNWLRNQKPEQNYAGDDVVKLRVAGWDTVSEKSGLAYVSGRVSPPMEPKVTASPSSLDF